MACHPTIVIHGIEERDVGVLEAVTARRKKNQRLNSLSLSHAFVIVLSFYA
jgi:hypothetical protein